MSYDNYISNKMKRTIIKIDEEKCNGCGACIVGCHEGALQLINGKAVMISDLYCDGLGACIGDCPVGAITLEEREAEPYNEYGVMKRQFPIQLHLLNPQAGFFQKENVLLAADCTAFASGDFHSRFLKGKMLAIACPKLDANQQNYIDKLTVMIDVAQIDTLTVLIMEVPCCSGLIRIAEQAREKAQRHIPIKVIVLSVQGELISEKWT